MTPDARRSGSDRQAAFADLATVLRTIHGDDDARDMAAAVFRHATGTTTLVGLTESYERVVYYDDRARTLTAARVDEHGLHREDAAGLWNRLSDPTTWVDANCEDLDWVHPRYRWVVDDDESVWRFPRGPDGSRGGGTSGTRVR